MEVEHHGLYENLGKTPQERQIAYRGLMHALAGQQELDLLNRKSGVLGAKKIK